MRALAREFISERTFLFAQVPSWRRCLRLWRVRVCAESWHFRTSRLQSSALVFVTRTGWIKLHKWSFWLDVQKARSRCRILLERAFFAITQSANASGQLVHWLPSFCCQQQIKLHWLIFLTWCSINVVPTQNLAQTRWQSTRFPFFFLRFVCL